MKHTYLSAIAVAGLFSVAHAQDHNPQPTTDSAMRTFNPAISVILDTYLYADDSEEGISHVKEEIQGFGGHSHGEDEHDHGGVENGFNLRHLEIAFSAEIDNYFKALAIAAISENDAEIEIAEIVTTGLPWGLQAKAGKFYSDFGYINAQHAHEWSFTDQPLIYELALGEHGLNEKGAQLTWLAPTSAYLLFGAEIFQGENEKMFTQEESDELPQNDGPRLGVGWVKFAPLQAEKHALQLGLFGASGSHQEIHGEDPNFEYFDGRNWFAGADAVYKYDAGKAYGEGDATLQAEYFYRDKELDLQGESEQLTATQDGYYIQGTYGFMPRWRGGLRWEQVGLTNEEQEEEKESFGDSWRAAAMLDFHPSEFSMIRFQVNNGEYATEDGDQNVWEGFLQLTVSLGAHGAHTF